MEHDVPACRLGVTDEDRAFEADRRVLYAALLLARRPQTRVKPQVVAAAQELLPAVQAYLSGGDKLLAEAAERYAQACGAEEFLQAKRREWLNDHPLIATFSIVARDMANGDFGVAVASKFLAVGMVVPWAQADAGAVATQAWANMTFGPDGLSLLAQGNAAEPTLKLLLDSDEGRQHRQVGLVDSKGRAATWTGSECMDWAGGVTGAGYAIQGNILAGEHVIQAMATAFEQTEGELAERLMAALLAGDVAGGDRRGRQSAALYVARKGGAYGGLLDRYIDLRVDDHQQPVQELERLLKLHRFYLQRPDPATLLAFDQQLVREVQTMLHAFDYYQGPINGSYDAATHQALDSYAGVENLEERIVGMEHIDPLVLEYMRTKYQEHSS